MIKYFFFFIVPVLGFSQVQVGQGVNGEASNDFFGSSVSLSSNGNVLAVGANGNDGNGNGSGHVRVYENQSGTWVQIGQDIDGEGAGDIFGTSVSLSFDGSVLAIGGANNDGNNSGLSGHVRVYGNQSGTWVQIGQDIDGEGAFDHSGTSVSLSLDGGILAIGANGNDGNGNGSGHVRVYENQSGTWTQIGQDINGEASNDGSGSSVSLSSDGSILAIGASENDGNGNDSGHVRVYENQSGTWVQIGQDIDGEAAFDNFGSSVSLSSDGSVLAIGAIRNDGNGNGSGHVRVYENQSGTWGQIGQDIDGEAAEDRFGTSVSISANGNILAIGASFNDGGGNNSGHVRVYKNQSGTWVQIGQDIDGSPGDLSGVSMSLSSDGSVVAIGAPSSDANGILSGQVRVYDLSLLLSVGNYDLIQCNLYPNPTKNMFNIELSNNDYLDKIYIYDSLGQLIKISESLQINISNFSSGLYYVEIRTSKGKLVKKLIIE